MERCRPTPLKWALLRVARLLVQSTWRQRENVRPLQKPNTLGLPRVFLRSIFQRGPSNRLHLCRMVHGVHMVMDTQALFSVWKIPLRNRNTHLVRDYGTHGWRDYRAQAGLLSAEYSTLRRTREPPVFFIRSALLFKMLEVGRPRWPVEVHVLRGDEHLKALVCHLHLGLPQLTEVYIQVLPLRRLIQPSRDISEDAGQAVDHTPLKTGERKIQLAERKASDGDRYDLRILSIAEAGLEAEPRTSSRTR
jgi:hypothetical protein